mmetsp:Transcript_93155/g.290421  ORF Transcript_93155/g.290421 Transcript_93155/m.290421 type:complete len:231 (-) Transcript_93155:236-928(-)
MQVLLAPLEGPLQPAAAVPEGLQLRVEPRELSLELLQPAVLRRCQLSKLVGHHLGFHCLDGGVALGHEALELRSALPAPGRSLPLPGGSRLGLLRGLGSPRKVGPPLATAVLQVLPLGVERAQALGVVLHTGLGLCEARPQALGAGGGPAALLGELQPHEARRVLVATRQGAAAADLVALDGDGVEAVHLADLVAELEGPADDGLAEDLLHRRGGPVRAADHAHHGLHAR